MFASISTTARRTVGALALLALFATGAVVLVQDTEAGPAFYTEYTYYSDGTLTTPVGVRIQTCSGQILRYGSISRHWEVFEFPCAIDPDPGL